LVEQRLLKAEFKVSPKFLDAIYTYHDSDITPQPQTALALQLLVQNTAGLQLSLCSGQ
jgi:hypothetical protein